MASKYLIVNLGSQTKKYALANESGEIIAREQDLSVQKFLENNQARNEIAKIGIRIVAPGTFFTSHQILDGNYLEKLKIAARAWPLHLEPVIAELDSLKQLLPDIPILALSDSAFHQPLPDEARFFPINQGLANRLDLYRFGYHGLSVASIVRQLSNRGEALPKKIIVAHLGGGASVTALLDGKTLETSMGYTPFSGLISSTRVGELDPGALIQLVRESGLSLEDLTRELEMNSGLLALSESTGEVRELLIQEKAGNQKAQFTLQIFGKNILKYLAANLVVLGGADLIVLTGAIAEGSDLMVQRLRGGLQPLAVSSEKVIVLPTDEMGEMARLLK